MFVAMVVAALLPSTIIPYAVKIFNKDKARIKDKNGKTIYKDEYLEEYYSKLRKMKQKNAKRNKEEIFKIAA